ncbi:hypothetical protein DLAC_02212 [Tieghemostelium lacteum]|uniref:PH domain-containing protein n=1 Tax=Tieghemostelium lacteum TaxID=361077 RepID=A0A152A4E5_TIELA|nr:hypothetical protein DLAC_02212 [Tieghemostelium lacteum]|eukprot:KYR01110.1 hypothetical protein DLAC_02212 [Tieghemostelium lacteum]
MKELINLKGYLYKKGTGLTSNNWKKRWFILSNGVILNYYVDDKLEKKPKGTIYLEIVESIQIDSSGVVQAQAQQYRFQLTTKKRVYYLYAETEQDRVLWLDNLNQCLVNFKKPTERARSNTLPSVVLNSNDPTAVTVSGSVQPSQPNKQFQHMHQSLPTPQVSSPVTPNTNRQHISSPPTTANAVVSNYTSNNNNNTTNSKKKTLIQKNKNSESKFRICGAKMLDKVNTDSNGFVTCMTTLTRNKLWSGDSKGNINVWTISRSGDSDKMVLSYQIKEKEAVTGLVYVPEKKILYSACKDGSGISCWDTHDHHKIFSFPTKVLIDDMVELRNEMLLYCGSDGKTSSLYLFDPSTKQENEIPFQSFLPPLLNATSSVYRKFIKLFKMDGKILAATDQSEIIIWNPWEKEACKVINVGHSKITALTVISGVIWVCSLQESTGIFSLDLPCIVKLYSLETTKLTRSFESEEVISQFQLVNGYVWAISRESVSIYDPSTGQILYEYLDLQSDMNYCALFSHGYCWIGGSSFTRFLITDQWVDHNMSHEDRSPHPDLSIENLKYLLGKIKSRLEFEHNTELYDVVLKIGELTLQDTSLNFYKIKIAKLFSYFGRNRLDYINQKIIFKQEERINRISNLLQKYLQDKSDQILCYETLKTLNYLCNFNKFCKYIKIDNILKILNDNDQPSQTAMVYSRNQISMINLTLLIVNQMIELDPTICKNNQNFTSDFKSKMYFSLLSNLNLDSSIHFSVINLFKKMDQDQLAKVFKKSTKQLQVLFELVKGDGLLAQETFSMLQEFCRKKPEFKDQIGKQVPNIDRVDDSLLISHYISPNLKKSLMADATTHKESQQRDSIMAHHSTSLISSIIFSMNSLLKTLKSKSLKGAKISVKEINVPNGLDISKIVADSIIKLLISFPKNDFVMKIYFELAPKDLSLVLEVVLGVKGQVHISDISIKGHITVGFVIGTSRLHWMSFDQDPEINFQMKAVGIGLESVLKPLIMKIIRKKFVSPNLYHLSEF